MIQRVPRLCACARARMCARACAHARGCTTMLCSRALAHLRKAANSPSPCQRLLVSSIILTFSSSPTRSINFSDGIMFVNIFRKNELLSTRCSKRASTSGTSESPKHNVQWTTPGNQQTSLNALQYAGSVWPFTTAERLIMYGTTITRTKTVTEAISRLLSLPVLKAAHVNVMAWVRGLAGGTQQLQVPVALAVQNTA